MLIDERSPCTLIFWPFVFSKLGLNSKLADTYDRQLERGTASGSGQSDKLPLVTN